MRILLSITLFLFSLTTLAQNREQVVKDINILCSDSFAGRGYINNGDKKAADYIASRFKDLGLNHFGENYFQKLSFPVNSFSGEMMVEIDNHELVPGVNFIVHPGCPSINSELTIFSVKPEQIDEKKELKTVIKQLKKYEGWALVYDPKKYTDEKSKKTLETLKQSVPPSLIIELTDNNLVWWVSTKQETIPILMVDSNFISDQSWKIKVNIKAKLSKHSTQNVIGYIKGTEQPDSFIVITAHYDHLGMMGKETIFPGANDNASGTAMMLDFAKYYSEHPPKYSICFMAFCGEEAGLLGSYYYTANPLFPLKQISFLINMDLMASGEDGIMAVNGKVFTQEWDILNNINTEKNYLTKVDARPKAANSDHYFFTEKGVKAFFFYLMGPYNNYHDVYDKADAIPLSLYNESFNLIREFIDALQNRY